MPPSPAFSPSRRRRDKDEVKAVTVSEHKGRDSTMAVARAGLSGKHSILFALFLNTHLRVCGGERRCYMVVRRNECRPVPSLLSKLSFENISGRPLKLPNLSQAISVPLLLRNKTHADRCQSRIFSPRRQSQHIPRLAILEHMAESLTDLTNLPRLQPFTCTAKCKCNSGFLLYIIPATFTLLAMMGRHKNSHQSFEKFLTCMCTYELKSSIHEIN